MFKIVTSADGTQFLRRQKQERRSKQFQSDLDNLGSLPYPWHTCHEQAPQVIPQCWKVTTRKTWQREKLECVVLDTKDPLLTHYRGKMNKLWGIYSEKYIEEEIILEMHSGMSFKRVITKKVFE